MRKLLCAELLFFFLVIFSSSPVFANSSYVLPYPSAMPGSIFYKVNIFKEKIMELWYFGSFGKFTYNLRLSDKYLVEAKTLFEYKQYLLASQALNKSDEYFRRIKPELDNAGRRNKNIEQKKKIFESASLKHIEELNFIQTLVPEKFVWQPEKSASTNLNFKEQIEEAIKIRKIYEEYK